IDSRGYIVTNHHVVEDVNVIRVRLSDGNTYTAMVQSRDHEADLALLKIDAGRPLPTMPLGTARDIMVGETVIAIGNAYGYEHTVTVGVVSAVGRDVALNKDVSYKALIQTDASINPGNSGGPLLNINGELVGVNVAIRAGAQGIGLATRVDALSKAAAGTVDATVDGRAPGPDDLIWDKLGLKMRPVPAESVNHDNPQLQGGLVVTEVQADGPAAHAGVQRGDVLIGLHTFAMVAPDNVLYVLNLPDLATI